MYAFVFMIFLVLLKRKLFLHLILNTLNILGFLVRPCYKIHFTSSKFRFQVVKEGLTCEAAFTKLSKACS